MLATGVKGGAQTNENERVYNIDSVDSWSRDLCDEINHQRDEERKLIELATNRKTVTSE